jgi:hypothetical protein
MATPDALRDWEEFLMAFQNCGKMRRVDFSDNSLGDKGIEILVRVYTRRLRDPIVGEEGEVLTEPMSRSTSNLSQHSDEDEFISMEGSVEYGSSPATSLAASALIKSNRRSSDDLTIPNRGLPSIAYIHLNNVGMTDLSALHLTYLLPYHNLPHVLLRRLDSQIADSTSNIHEDELYDPDSLCRGIMYDLDQDISPLGKKILESVEKVRRAGCMKPQPLPPTVPSTPHAGSVPPSPPDSFRARRNSDSSRGYFPETQSPSRKDSISSIRTTTSHGRTGSLANISPSKLTFDIPPHWTDVLKMRPKIQGEILKSAGIVHVSQLWSAGIKLLSLTRVVTLPQATKAPANPKGRSRHGKRRSNRIILPPSPISPGIPECRSLCYGGLPKMVWMQIMRYEADPEGVLSERQAIAIVDWASDRASLAKEGEWAGKLRHVQMWKLLDVSLFQDTDCRLWIA